jgi:hypothetical protein
MDEVFFSSPHFHLNTRVYLLQVYGFLAPRVSICTNDTILASQSLTSGIEKPCYPARIRVSDEVVNEVMTSVRCRTLGLVMLTMSEGRLG